MNTKSRYIPSADRKKEIAAGKRALSKRYFIGAQIGDPINQMQFARRDGLAEKVALYAAAIGRQRGVLPADLSGWLVTGQCNMQPDQDGRGAITFTQYEGAPEYFDRWDQSRIRPRKVLREITLEIENLNWTPDEPIDESEPDPMDDFNYVGSHHHY